MTSKTKRERDSHRRVNCNYSIIKFIKSRVSKSINFSFRRSIDLKFSFFDEQMSQDSNLTRSLFDMKIQSQTIRYNESFRARSRDARIDLRNIIEDSNQEEFDRLETSISFFKFAFSLLIKFERKFKNRHLDRRLTINFSKETITNVKLSLLNNIDENLMKFAIDDLEKFKIEIIENFDE